MSHLEYISDEKLFHLTKQVLDAVRKRREAASDEFTKNVIDPFSAIFNVAISEANHATWKESELTRQYQKTTSNFIGEFHQKILGSIHGWDDLEKGNEIDLVNHKNKIIAEIKNKFNTVSGGLLSEQYKTLDKLISQKNSKYYGYTAYFVTIIPKTPERINIPFEPSDRGTGNRCQKNEKIRLIDGASFYSLATGREHALRELYDILPVVIESIFNKEYQYKGFNIADKPLFADYLEKAYYSKK
jgi:hypothetical protein